MPTLKIDRETADRLRRVAAARGVSVTEAASECIARVAGAGETRPHYVDCSRESIYPPPDPPEPESAPDLPGPDRPLAEWLDAFAARHEPVTGFVDMSRESIYDPPE